MRRVLTLSAAGPALGLQGSCRAAKKCCDGKDTDCAVSQSEQQNSVLVDLLEEPCYCDHGCLAMGDCCLDFKDYCGGEQTTNLLVIASISCVCSSRIVDC